MDIKNEVQSQIVVNSGSEKRVINRTMERVRCSEKDVNEIIDWLLKKGFIKIVKDEDLTDCEKRYLNSDNCRILRNVTYYEEIKYFEDEAKRKEQEKVLPNKEKFATYFSRMEKEFEWKNFFNKKNYELKYGDNDVTIFIKDNDRIESIKIDFGITTDWFYDEPNNVIFYKSSDKRYQIELYYLWGNCNLKHYFCY